MEPKLPPSIAEVMAQLAEMSKGNPVVFPVIPWQSQPIPKDVRVLKDIIFRHTPQRPLLLDLYLPPMDPAEPLPLVIWIYGGGWIFGDKGGCPPAPFAGRGFAAASISYRFSSEAPFPAQIADVRAAIRFLRAYASQYHLDPKRFGVWGASAGGHLCALLGTGSQAGALDGDNMENLDVSCEVQAVCNMAGPCDLTVAAEMDRNKYATLVECSEWLVGGGPAHEKRDALRVASPIHYIAGKEPPFFTVFGEKDDVVPASQGRMLHDALRKAGCESTLLITPNDGHGVESFDFEDAWRFFHGVLGEQ